MSSHDVTAKPARMKGYALVRDKNGRPKVDKPELLPDEIKRTLTKEDLEYLYGPSTHHRSS